MPPISKSKSLDNKNFPFLKMKSEFGINQNSNSYWIPFLQKRAIMSNRSSVEYDIINNRNN